MNKSRATPSAADTPVQTDGPGQRLAAERQARGIDIDRIAALLHLRLQVVEALEADRYDQLPDPVFVAGYLRNYARVLGIDASSIVDDYKSRVPDLESALALAPTQTDREPETKSGGLLARLATLVLFGAAVGLLALWWQGQRVNPAGEQGSSPTAASTDQTTPETASAATGIAAASTAGPVTTDQTTATAADTQPESRTDTTSPTPTVPAVPPQAGTTSEATADDDFGTARTATAPSGPGRVELEFTGASWIDVRGADGKLVLNGEMRAGDRHVLNGQPPFKLVIGNSAATRMTVDGQPFDLQPRARGNVARFTFDPAAPR